MENQRLDAILMEVLCEQKTVTGFLHAIFGFLRRKTDFYYVQKDSTEKIGFPKGIRERIVYSTMQHYDPQLRLNNLTTEDGDDAGHFAPPAVEEVEVETCVENCVNIVEPDVEMKKKGEVTREEPPLKNLYKKADFSPADYKNGALHSNYCWSQTLKDVEIHIKLPVELDTAKSLKVEIKSDHIAVSSKTNPNVVIFKGNLINKFKHNDAVWTIEAGQLLISIDKTMEKWWEKLFTSEESIDMKKIDCEQFIDELPEESQAAIHKLRNEQMRKNSNNQMGIGKTDSETLEKLRKAWDAEGSPFKGQPFDPSVLKFS